MKTVASTLSSAALLAGVLCVLASPGRGIAGTVAFDPEAGRPGNQAFGGSLGLDFNVGEVGGSITVTDIGVYDADADGLNAAINVAIFDRATQAVVAGTQTMIPAGGGTLVGGSRFVPLAAPVVLPSGFRGTVVAWGYGAAEQNGNGAPLPAFNGTGGVLLSLGNRYSVDPGAFPATLDGAPAKYSAGTFMYDAEYGPTGGVATALQVAGGTVGQQNFGGALGIDFVATRPLSVSSLGVFDSGSDGIAPSASIIAELWRRDDMGTGDPGDDVGLEMLASLSFSAGDDGLLEGGSRFKDLPTALTLDPGAYTIVAHGYNADELLGNAGFDRETVSMVDTEAGSVEFVGTGRFGVTAGEFPGSPDAGPANRYLAGTFKYTVVPEPAVGGLLAAAGAAVLLVRRRRVRSW